MRAALLAAAAAVALALVAAAPHYEANKINVHLVCHTCVRPAASPLPYAGLFTCGCPCFVLSLCVLCFRPLCISPPTALHHIISHDDVGMLHLLEARHWPLGFV